MQVTRNRNGLSKERARILFGILFSLLGIVVLLLVASSTDTYAGTTASTSAPGTNSLTSEEDVQARPEVTLSGKIVFQYRDPDHPDGVLATVNADGSDFQVIFNHPPAFNPETPEWSRDGRRIVFRLSGDLREGEASSARPQGNTNLISIDPDGSNAFNITAAPNQEGTEPAWSPDGTQIAYEDSSAINVINANGTGAHPITFDFGTTKYWPSWKPDGTKILYVERDSNSQTHIVIINPDGTGSVIIPNGNPNLEITQAEWSPDGTKIAFSGVNDQLSDYDVFVMNADGTNVHQLTTGLAQSNHPSWSPDGNWIAVNGRTGPGQLSIYGISIDGSIVQPIFVPPTGQFFAIYTSWGQGEPNKVVKVENPQGNPVRDAMVYKNCELLGTTDISGTLSIPGSLALGDQFVARSLVYTGTTQKGGHDGWAYHVWLTNIRQTEFGYEAAYSVTDTSRLTQTLVISPMRAQIGLNILASVEFNASDRTLEVIGSGLGGTRNPNGGYLLGGSDYLMDITDGQMYLEKVTIYEDKQHWADADYQFFAYFPRANANTNSDGISMLTGTGGHIHMQASGDFGTPWTQTSAFSTMIHELSHYAIGAYDEYYFQHDGDNASCTLNPNPAYGKRASIMSNNRNSSEFCTSQNHNSATYQGAVHQESVWETFDDNWSDPQNRWQLVDPVERGFTVPGPDVPLCTEVEGAVPLIVNSPVQPCGALTALVTDDGTPVVGASVTLEHNGNSIDEGITDANGLVRVFGVVPGDKVTARGTGFPGSLYTGEVTVAACGPIEIELSVFRSGAEGKGSAAPSEWPAYGINAISNFTTNKVTALLQFTADTPAAPVLYASQGGLNRQQVALTYNAAQHTYTGDYTFNPSKSLDFKLEVGLTGPQGVILFPYTFAASKYQSTGPFGEQSAAPSTWDLFQPETMINLSVNSTSMPSNTGIMGGRTELPAALPEGMKVVGGPFSVQGQNAVSGQVFLSLEYQDEYFCGLVQGSTAIYRFNGAGWDELGTMLDEDWHIASTTLSAWGTYAVFAQLSPQASFTDVPPGSTFYDYIGWITCHGIASGYADSTFKPNNNATRGQISKMMALTYKWQLEPLATDYTFADVLPGSTFFQYVEAAYKEGVVGGYTCGGAGEPCDSANRPYFRPANNVTRGQIAKIIATGSKFADPVTGQTFQDVAPGSTFYQYIERMASRTIINGYPCGGAGEPCGAGNKPYFRPSANATRGQLSKMIYLAAQPR